MLAARTNITEDKIVLRYEKSGVKIDLRPYLINFDATGSPCHELTSWDNSSSMSIWLGRKESYCEDILPVSSTDEAVISPTISLALSVWCTRKCEIKENLSGVLLLHVKLRNTKYKFRNHHQIAIFFYFPSIYIWLFIFLQSHTHPIPPTLTETLQVLNREKKRSIPISFQNLSMSWV